jgi:hypothetical protein
MAAQLRGQQKDPAQYRLQIRMRETRAQSMPKDSAYSLLLQDGGKGSVNASYRVPYYSSSKGEVKELHTVALGAIFECSAREADGGVRLDCAFESSFVSPKAAGAPPVGFPPLVQSRQAHVAAVIALGAETSVAELDDPTTGGRVQFFIAPQRVNAADSGSSHRQ